MEIKRSPCRLLISIGTSVIFSPLSSALKRGMLNYNISDTSKLLWINKDKLVFFHLKRQLPH